MSDTRALRTAARHGLPGAEEVTIEVAPVDTERLLARARRDRLAPLLHAAVSEGVVQVPTRTEADLVDLWHEQLVGCVIVESVLVGAANVLDEAGVEWRLSKGSALAHLDYPDPSLRTFGDVDILVHPRSWDAAERALRSDGWRREVPELAAGFDDAFGKGATLVNADSLEIDLHRRLAVGSFGVRLATESLFTDPAVIEIAGTSVRTPSTSGRLLHACFHAALGGFREFRAHRDVAQLVLVTAADWRQTVEVAERSQVDTVVARAIRDTWQVLDLDIDHPAVRWARGRRIGRRDAATLRIFTQERSFRQQALTAVPDLIGRGAMRYLTALVRQPGRRPSLT